MPVKSSTLLEFLYLSNHQCLRQASFPRQVFRCAAIKYYLCELSASLSSQSTIVAPTILFVPGLWEGPTPFIQVSTLLQAQGYATETTALPSTGKISPGNPTMEDDIAAIRATVERLVIAEQDVLLVLHSAGAFLGSNAIEGLGAKARAGKGLKGGVVGIVFLAGVALEGFEHGPLPFAVLEGGAMNCASPEKFLFNDLNDAEKGHWLKALQPQPAAGWEGTVTYCGWRDVPSVYLVCEGDALLPAALQMKFAELTGGRIERCGAGHMVMLSMPEKVVEAIVGAVEAW